MKKLLVILICLSNYFAFSQEKDLNYYISQAPFKMPEVTIPTFPDKTFSITDYGAVSDGQTMNTNAFINAIAACEKAGGGTVVIPPGEWLTGPFELESNINLHADRGALVIFSTDHNQYPIIHPSGNSFMVQPPIYGYKLQNVAITGEGIFDGSGETWRPVKKSKVTNDDWKKLIASGGVVSKDGNVWWPSKEAMDGEYYLKGLKGKKELTADDLLPARDFLRSKMVVFSDCNNILLDGPTFKNSPSFMIYPQNCTNVTIRNVQVNNDFSAQNGDGIDISGCRGVIIYNCTVNAGDDGICMKSSGKKGPDFFALENVLIANCIVYKAHGGFVIGSNTDGGMRNIFVTNCDYIGTDIGIRVKSNAGRGGVVKDIFIKNIFMKDIVNEAISFNDYYENVPAGKTIDSVRTTVKDKIPVFQDFHISNVICHGAKMAVAITGIPEMPIQKIHFENMTIAAGQGVKTDEATDIEFKNVKIIPSKGPVYTLNNSNNIHIINGYFSAISDQFLKAETNVNNVTISGTDLRGSSSAIQLGEKIDKNAVKVE